MEQLKDTTAMTEEQLSTDAKILVEKQSKTLQQAFQPAAHIVIGKVTDIINRQAIVSYEKNLLPYTQPALATISITASDIGRQVVLQFTEQGQAIAMGFLTPALSPESKINNTGFDIIQDGEHCQIRASKSITLQCGNSSVTLNSQGEIVINGENIVSKARKKNNILGGTINLN